MEQGYEFTLKQSRSDQIQALGFLCYNLYVDGAMVFPEMNETVETIKKTLNFLLLLKQSNANPAYLKMHETELNEKLTELGCICYNLYIDSKLVNNKVLELCNSISTINSEMDTGVQRPAQKAYPYAMEQIPEDYKPCPCGYKNRAQAKYCAKCGTKLS